MFSVIVVVICEAIVVFIFFNIKNINEANDATPQGDAFAVSESDSFTEEPNQTTEPEPKYTSKENEKSNDNIYYQVKALYGLKGNIDFYDLFDMIMEMIQRMYVAEICMEMK